MKTAEEVKAEFIRLAAQSADAGEATRAELLETAAACGISPGHFMTAGEFRSLRYRLGLSQIRLGRLLGMSGASVSLYELGHVAEPGPVALLMRLIEKHGVGLVLDAVQNPDPQPEGDAHDRP